MKERRKPSMLIAMIAMIAAIGLVLSFGWTAYAAEDEPVVDEDRVNALWPIGKDIEASPGGGADGGVELQEDLPASYRSDKELWAAGIRVKDQGKSGLCWAFSTTSAAEYSYALENYEKTGAVSETSPGHLAFFAFNRVNDPLGNTEGDSMKILPGEDPWPLIGGNSLVAMQHLATWSGLGLENNTLFDNINRCIDEDETTGKDIWNEARWQEPGNRYDDSSAYNDVYTLENSEFYWLEDEGGHDVLKNLVHEYGAVSVSIDMNTKKYLNDDTGAFYKYEGGNDTDHAVTVVGWKDDYPKENFVNTDKRIPAPQNDGAWVVQNSWGDDWPSGGDGFFYVSYESIGFTTDNTAAAYDMQPADAYAYNFQYDGTPGTKDTSESGCEAFRTSKGTWAANVFTNTTGGSIALDAVGMTTYSTDTSKFMVQVYTGLTDADDPTGGYRAADVTVTTGSAGVKTVPLPQSVTIGPGEKYAIVFCFDQGPNKFGVEVTEEKPKMGVRFKATTAPHQSFFSASDSSPWVDMNDYNACFRIKGLANDAYTVTFTDGFGKVIATRYAAKGQSVTPPANPKKDGYIFNGWKGSYSKVTKDTVVTATWIKKITPKVTLSSTSYTYDGKVKTPSVTVKDGSKTISKSNYTVSYPSGRKNAGTYRVKVTLKGSYSGSGSASFTIKKAANTLTVKGKTAKVKYAKLKKKKQTLARAKVITVTKPVGKVTYSIATVKLGKKAKAKYRKQIKMNKTIGKITLKKGMKKGVYRVTAKVTAAGNGNHKPVTRTVVFKIRMK